MVGIRGVTDKESVYDNGGKKKTRNCRRLCTPEAVSHLGSDLEAILNSVLNIAWVSCVILTIKLYLIILNLSAQK